MLRKIVNRYRLQFWNPIKYAKHIGVSVGDNCSIMTKKFGSEPYLIEIGNHVQVTSGVRFATHGAGWVFRQENPKFDFFGKIKVGNNVYIGNNALILPGVEVEDNVIIGAGSVVTKSIPKNSIVGGNPARIIGNVDDFKKKITPYNLNIKGVSYTEKMKILQSLSSDKFFKK